MTRLEALRGLYEAVKAGGYPDRQTEVMAFYLGGSIADCNAWANLARTANYGSVDAALALIAATLPGWAWGRWSNGHMWVTDNVDNADRFTTSKGYHQDNPAAALLLACIAALIAIEEGNG
jgi:hypothetical protein